jgi:FkbM family methyltransferase
LSGVKKIIPPSARATIGRSLRNLTRKPSPSFGRDFIGEVKSRLPRLNVETIFDVGAHIGITALEYSDQFRAAHVYAFEPGSDNFRRMTSNLIGKPDIRRYQIGFGASERTATLFMDPVHPSMARLVEKPNSNSENVTIDTIDHFCEVNQMRDVDILKIDTEGHEIQVLTGAYRMLSAGSISIVKAEVAADPDSNYHTSFFSLFEFLTPFGYRLFGIYDQCENEFSSGPRLRRFDAAFIGGQLIRLHGDSAWIASPRPGGGPST